MEYYGVAVSVVLLYNWITNYLRVKKLRSAIGVYRAALARLGAQIHAQTRQNGSLLRADEDLRRFRHDFQNLKIGLAALLREGDIRGAIEFLEACGHIVLRGEAAYKTGNLTADALLSEKRPEAASNGVHIVFDGAIPNAGLAPADVCVILGNLLDNAAEACAALPGEKTVSLSSRHVNHFLLLTVQNPVPANIPIRNNAPLTRKRAGRGVGLASVKSAIRKYGGDMELSCRDHIFTAAVTLDLNERWERD